MKRIYFLIFLFVLLTKGSHAQYVDNAIDYKWIDESRGLKHLGINNFAIDNNGFVWIIATGLGIHRYDGQKAVLFQDPTYPDIGNNRIFSFYKDPNTGEIYFQTFPTSKTYVIKNSSVRKINNSEGLFINQNLFLKATDPFYKAYLNHLKTSKEAFIDFGVHNAIANNNFMYLFYANHLVCLDRNGGKTIISSPFINSNYTCKFGESILLIGTKVGVLTNTKITYGTVKTDRIMRDVLQTSPFPGRDLAISAQGQDYFLCHKQKLYKISYEDHYLHTQYVLDLPENSTNRFSYDKANDLYFFSTADQGIVIVYPKKFNTINKFNQFKFNDYTVVQKDEKWYNYTGWIYDREANKIESRTITNYGGNIRFLLEYKDDFLYQATNNCLVSIVDLKTKLQFKLYDNLGLVTFTYLNKKLWLANENYIGFVDKQKIISDTLVTQHLKEGQHINTINSFRGNLLIGTTKGVFLHKPFSSPFDYIKGLEHVNARYFKFLDQKNFWVGCYGEGLFLVYNDKVYPVNNTRGDIKTAHAIEEDKAGNLWISTNDGLITLDKKSALQSILNHQPVDSYIYTVEDGLLSNEFNGGSTHPSLKTQDGIIGFPSMKGFVWFYPENVKKHLFSGNIVIDNVILDNAKSVVAKNGSYSIAENAKILKINFSYGYHFNRDNLTISYKFEDQKNWTEIKGNSFQIGRYKKGSHKLQLKIKTYGFDSILAVTKELRLDFEPRYYEMHSFWLAITTLLILLIYIAYAIGKRFQRKKEIELQNKIDEKTLILKETVLELEHSKNAVTDSLLEKEILLREIHHRVKNNLQLVISMMSVQALRANYKNIDEFIETTRIRIASMSIIHQSLYQGSSLAEVDVDTYIKMFFKELKTSFASSTNVSVASSTNNITFNISTAIPFGLIVNEIMTNALKHAFPNNKQGAIKVNLERQNDLNILTIEDNGIWFKPATTQNKSFGLDLISLLVRQLKGTLVLENENGTKYTITFADVAEVQSDFS